MHLFQNIFTGCDKEMLKIFLYALSATSLVIVLILSRSFMVSVLTQRVEDNEKSDVIIAKLQKISST